VRVAAGSATADGARSDAGGGEYGAVAGASLSGAAVAGASGVETRAGSPRDAAAHASTGATAASAAIDLVNVLMIPRET
jgi:hypothetical protein